MQNAKKQIVKKALSAVKMVDMGHKMDDDCCTPLSSSKMKKKIYYPSFYLSSKEAGMLKDTKVGDKKKIIIEAMLRSKTVSDNGAGEDRVSADIEIKKMGIEE